MRFSTYLNESKSVKNEATLVLHKILHMIDHGHVDVTDKDIRFAVGPMIHMGAYNKLQVVIRKANSIGVKLGKLREGEGSVIVIDTKTLPERTKIDNLLSEKEVFEGFITAFTKYLSTVHDHKADHPQHASEAARSNNDNFEANYNALVAEFGEKIEEYQKAHDEVHSHVNNSADIIKHETTKISLRELQKEYLGTTEAEFLGLVKKLPGYTKFEKIEKELSTKLDSRLKAYYNTTVAPLLEEKEETTEEV